MNKYDRQKLVESMSLTDVWADIDAIVDSDININYILSLGEPYPYYFAKQYEKILSLGADPVRLFHYNEEYYKMQTSMVKDLAYALSVYADCGLGYDFAKQWILDNIPAENIVPNSVYLEPFGINPRDYVDTYLEHDYAASALSLDSLPYPVTPDDVVRHFSIRELKYIYAEIGGFRYDGFGAFVDNFAEAGGDIDLLVDKFLKELGYPEEKESLAALAIMKHHGTDLVDANKIVDTLTFDAFVYKDQATIKKVKLWFLDMLIDHIDTQRLTELRN